MTHDFTVSDVVAQARRLANERPDFVYETDPETGMCAYVHNAPADEDGNQDFTHAEPGCLFGHALHTLGVPLEEMAADTSIECLLRELGLLAYHPGDGTPTPLEVDWCCQVQGLQDTACPWGQAVALVDQGKGILDR